MYYGDVAVTEPVIPPEAIQPPVYNPPAYRPPSPTGVYSHYVSPFEDINASSNDDNNESSQQSGAEPNQGQESLLDISTEESTVVTNDSRLQEGNDGIQLVQLDPNRANISAFRPFNEHRRNEDQDSENHTHDVENNSAISNTEETNNLQNSSNPFAPSDDEEKDSDDDKLLADDDLPLLQ